MHTLEDVRRTIGRRRFTVRELADVLALEPEQARAIVRRLCDAGSAERTDEVAQYVDERGRPTRGRPQHVYRLR
ncbi:MAG: hypothetical protein RLZZ272_1490 [Actinomycetota bacterium]